MHGSDIIGAVGVTILLVAFVLNMAGRLSSSSLTYHSLNAGGAAMSCTASVLIGYMPFVILEGCWGLVAVVGIVRTLHATRVGMPAPAMAGH